MTEQQAVIERCADIIERHFTPSRIDSKFGIVLSRYPWYHKKIHIAGRGDEYKIYTFAIDIAPFSDNGELNYCLRSLTLECCGETTDIYPAIQQIFNGKS